MSFVTDSPCLLIVEDDVPTRTFLADNLTADGYELLVVAACATRCASWSSTGSTSR